MTVFGDGSRTHVVVKLDGSEGSGRRGTWHLEMVLTIRGDDMVQGSLDLDGLGEYSGWLLDLRFGGIGGSRVLDECT